MKNFILINSVYIAILFAVTFIIGTIGLTIFPEYPMWGLIAGLVVFLSAFAFATVILLCMKSKKQSQVNSRKEQ